MEFAKVLRSEDGLVVVLPRTISVVEGLVAVHQAGDTVVLTPVPDNWDWLDAIEGEVDEDFIKHALDRPAWSGKGDD